MVDRRGSACLRPIQGRRLAFSWYEGGQIVRAAERSPPGQTASGQRHEGAQRRVAPSRARADIVGGRAGPHFRSEGYREVISAPPPYLVRAGSIITAIALSTLAI